MTWSSKSEYRFAFTLLSGPTGDVAGLQCWRVAYVAGPKRSCSAARTVQTAQSVCRRPTCTLLSVVQTTLADRDGVPAPHPAVALDFEHVSKTFPDGTQALDDVSLDVAAGEMVAIVGPSGCGKSTLLRLASRLTAPSERRDWRRRRQPGLRLPGRRRCCPGAPCSGNVELLAELAGRRRRQNARQLAAQAIALTGLSGFERHRPRALSGGMRMRVSLARALTMRPRIFLFDEPFGALDEITRERLNGELLGLFERERFAGLFVTHSVSEAAFLASRVLVMSPRPGRIVAEIAVPFGYPRAPELRFEPEFAQHRRPDLGAPAREAHADATSSAPPTLVNAPWRRAGHPGSDRRAVAQVVAPLIVFALVIGVWLFISYVLLEPRRRFLMPPPQDVVLRRLVRRPQPQRDPGRAVVDDAGGDRRPGGGDRDRHDRSRSR